MSAGVEFKRRFPRLECVFADAGYDAQRTYGAAAADALRPEAVHRTPRPSASR